MNPAPTGSAPLHRGTPPQYSLPPQGGGFSRGLLGWVLFVGLAVMLFFLLRNKMGPGTYVEVPLSDFYRLVREGKVQNLSVEDAEVRGRLTEATRLRPGPLGDAFFFRAKLPPGMGSSWDFNQWVLENANGARVEADTGGELVRSVLIPLIPWVLIFGFIWFFVYRQLRAQAGRAQQPLPVFVVNTAPPAPGSAATPAVPPQVPPQPPGASPA